MGNEKKTNFLQSVSRYEEGLLSGFSQFNDPKLARIEYEEGEVVLEDYTALDEYIEKVFLPNHLRISHDDINFLGSISFVYLNEIVSLNFNSIEIKHIIEFLDQKGIQVRGTSSFLNDFSSNYVYSPKHFFPGLESVDNLSSKEQQDLFKKYWVNKDICIRNKLVLCNMNLVFYILGKLKLNRSKEMESLLSYGMEGLIIAVSKYNPNLGISFSSFASPYIRGYILTGIRKNYGFKNSKFYDTFLKAKKRIEKERMIRLEEDLTLVDDILDLMYEMEKLNPIFRETYKRYIFSLLYFPLEEIDDNEYIEDSVLDLNLDYEIFKEKLKEILSTLDEQEVEIVSLYYGLTSGESLSMQKIADIKKISKQRVSQILCQARNKLKDLEDIEALKELVYDEIFSSESSWESSLKNLSSWENEHEKKYRKG